MPDQEKEKKSTQWSGRSLWSGPRQLHFCTSPWLFIKISAIIIPESKRSHWLLYIALLRDSWHRFELIGCWNKWHALHLNTDLWQLDKLSFFLFFCESFSMCQKAIIVKVWLQIIFHRQPAWVELRRTSSHCCNFPCNCFVSSWIFSANWT